MVLHDEQYEAYIQILKEELIPAFGCTEPIALAYAASIARQELGKNPSQVRAEVSGNIIKNVKSVIVPNTGGMNGIEAAVAAGIVAGKPEKQLEVIADIRQEQIQEISAFLEHTPIKVALADSEYIFDIGVILYHGEETVKVRIVGEHTNVVLIEHDGRKLLEKEIAADSIASSMTDRSVLNIQDIVTFADIADIEDVKPILDRQIAYNMAIAEEGIRSNYGANIGKVLLHTYGEDVKTKARAYAAAGSDARMNGCSLPVIICSGSGNQGITASVPVIVYARELGIDQDRLYRALLVSNLATIHQKTGIGRLSAYCGAISAGCGSGAGIAYLMGDGYEVIAHTLVNSLAIVSGIICDGAKASCAAKISTAVDAGLMGYAMYKQGQQFFAGDGIVAKGIEANIINIGLLAKEGMRETDKEILTIMTGK